MEDESEGGNDDQQNETISEQEIVQTNQAERVTLPAEEEEDEEEEEQVVPTANLFIPYNFVSAITPKEIAPRLETTQTETPITISSQSSGTNIDPIPVALQTETIKEEKPLVEPYSEANSQQAHTPTSPANVSLPSRKTKSPAVKTPKTPYTPKSREQLMLKQEIMEELRKLENRKWCKVCKKPFANNSTLTLHYSSLAHKKLVEKSLFGGDADKETKEKKVGGRKKSTTPTKRTINITPETSDDEEMEESLWEEEQIELMEEEDLEEYEPIEKKAKRGRPRQTLSVTSENEPPAQEQPVRRSRRSSTLDKTDSKENTNEENKETTHTSPTQTPSSKNKDKNLCTTCNVTFPSEIQLNKHYESKMHKTASFIVADGKPKVCSVCKVSFTTNNQLHRHYATQLHKTAAAKMVTELEGRGVIKTALRTQLAVATRDRRMQPSVVITSTNSAVAIKPKETKPIQSAVATRDRRLQPSVVITNTKCGQSAVAIKPKQTKPSQPSGSTTPRHNQSIQSAVATRTRRMQPSVVITNTKWDQSAVAIKPKQTQPSQPSGSTTPRHNQSIQSAVATRTRRMQPSVVITNTKWNQSAVAIKPKQTQPSQPSGSTTPRRSSRKPVRNRRFESDGMVLLSWCKQRL
ncbi:hypothetical protein WDU94_015490 [Cyamophila willieti]